MPIHTSKRQARDVLADLLSVLARMLGRRVCFIDAGTISRSWLADHRGLQSIPEERRTN
jgi:hypothetical protein